MAGNVMRIEEVWFGTTPMASLLRAALTPASWLYAFGWRCYAATYRFGFKRAAEPHRPVVCIGNLVVGGAGKTPATIVVAGMLAKLGEQVVISASGYGSPRSEAATLAPDGPLAAADWGDEPAMLRDLLPGIPLIVGRRRVLAAQLAHDHFPNAVLLMDDGFQHLPLRKHITVVLDSDRPRNTRCLPAGPYREPRRNLRLADVVLGDRFHLRRLPLTFQKPSGEPVSPPQKAAMVCAIGSPESFEASLADAGVHLVSQLRLGDHDPLTAGNLFAGLDPRTAIVVTAKDWAKLKARDDLTGRELIIAHQCAVIEPVDEFAAWLSNRLAEVRSK